MSIPYRRTLTSAWIETIHYTHYARFVQSHSHECVD